MWSSLVVLFLMIGGDGELGGTNGGGSDLRGLVGVLPWIDLWVRYMSKMDVNHV